MSEVRELYITWPDDNAPMRVDAQTGVAEVLPDAVTWPNVLRTLHETRNELHAYAAQLLMLQQAVTVLQARLDAWEADS